MKSLVVVLLLFTSLLSFGCTDGEDYKPTCCNAFHNDHDVLTFAMNSGLEFISPAALESVTGHDYDSYPIYSETMTYLCTLSQEMKGLNSTYKYNDNDDYADKCSTAITKYSAIKNQLETAYSQCCFVVKPKTFGSDCKGDVCKELEIEYLTCFKNYLTSNGECDYQIN